LRGGPIYARAPDHLGDVVMAIPPLHRLAERYPESGVDDWCPSVWAPILETAALPVDVMAFPADGSGLEDGGAGPRCGL
jgi:hypothetical protein